MRAIGADLLKQILQYCATLRAFFSKAAALFEEKPGFARLDGVPGGIRTNDPLLRRQSPAFMCSKV